MNFFNKMFFLISLSFFTTLTWSAGAVPQSTIVIVEEKDGEGSIDIKNTDPYPNLLLTRIENIPEDSEDLLVVFPPVARVEANDIQTVRFVLTSKEPLKTERLKRVIFEGVPPKNDNIEKEVNVTYKQNLPLIIRPKNLVENKTPWKELTWQITNNQLIVSNPSPYVVRFSSMAIKAFPQQESYNLPKSYILPHESFKLDISNSSEIKDVEFFPATTWGFAIKEAYKATVNK